MSQHFVKRWIALGKSVFGAGLLGGLVLLMGGSASSETPAAVASTREVEAVARVNGQEVSLERFNKLFDAFLQRDGQQQGGAPEFVQQAMKLGLVEQLIQEALIEDGASERGLFVQGSEIDAALAQYKATFKSEAEFERAVKQHLMGMDGLRERLRILRLRDRLVESEFPPTTETAVKAYYDSNPTRFDEPEHFVSREIVVRIEQQATALERQAKRARAEQLLQLVRTSGKPFEVLARQYSESSTAATGGDMGRVTPLGVDPRVWEALGRLKPGGISEPVETDDGLHLVKLIERKSAIRRSFAEVKSQVWAEFHEFMQRRRKEALMAQLREHAQISNLLAQRLASPSPAPRMPQGEAHTLGKSSPLSTESAPSTTAIRTVAADSLGLDL